MSYVFFCPDHAWRLIISYPYHAKSTHNKDHTEFRHLGINIRDYLERRMDGDILQSCVSFTQEDKKNCTVVLKRMPKTDRPKGCWQDIPSRESVGDYIHGIKAFTWKSEDEAKYNTKWEEEICSISDVRLSLPTLPRGSTGPATAVHRTSLP
jgi:hypothetical protein